MPLLRSTATMLALLASPVPMAASRAATEEVQPSPSAPQASLDRELQRIAIEAKGKVGAVAIDTGTGEVVRMNATEAFPLASVIKLPIVAYAFALADQGKLSLTKTFPIARADMVEPGILAEHFRHPGVALSTLNAIELSITQSDNGATDFILKRVGGPQAVNAWLRARGLGSINVGTLSLKDLFADGPRAPEPSIGGSPRTTTPDAFANFLAELQKGRLLSRRSTDALLDVMRRTAGERIKLHLPPGVQVLHKTGTLFGDGTMSVNDVGYILEPGQKPIVIAIFISDSPQSVPHAVRDAVIGDISRLIYDYYRLRAR